MWWFVLSLLLALLFPGSLLLPGIYGLAVGLFASMFGTIVGDWVDFNPRMKGTHTHTHTCIDNSLLSLSYSDIVESSHPEWPSGNKCSDPCTHVPLRVEHLSESGGICRPVYIGHPVWGSSQPGNCCKHHCC